MAFGRHQGATIREIIENDPNIDDWFIQDHDQVPNHELGEFWKYRVGDWRVICEIQDKQILITVLSLGNRREVYR